MRFSVVADRSLTLWVSLVGLGTLSATLGDLWWLLELATHFRVQLMFTGLVGIAAAMALRAWRRMALSMLLVALNTVPVLVAHATPPVLPPDTPRLRVATLNVNTFAGDPARVATWLHGAPADLVALTEVDARWVEALAPFASTWPHQAVVPHDGNFGALLLSRFPITAQRVEHLGGHPFPSLRATVASPLCPLEVVVLHAPPPMNAAWAQANAEQLAALAAHRRELGDCAVVLGDLNATPWSSAMDPLDEAGFKHGRLLKGIQPTWPDGLLWLLGVPIDHALVLGLLVTDHRVGPSVGSDHRPIVVELTAHPEGG